MVGQSPLQIQLSGGKEMEEILDQLPKRVVRKIIGKALRKGAGPIARDARRRARKNKRTGELARSITIRKTRIGDQRRRGVGQVVIGFRKPASRRAHLLEFGTWVAAAFAFFLPAVQAKGRQAVAAIGKTLRAEIEKEAEKLRKEKERQARKAARAARRRG